MLAELIIAPVAAVIFYLLFFGGVYYVAARLGYLADAEHELGKRRGAADGVG